jgi:putative hydroxymethylpyrimidine transport system ATP-binding protein
VLELDDITVRWGDAPVLAGVGLRVAPGEVVALVGPSGVGKSTLLDVAAGALAPDAGTTRWNGEVVGPVALTRLTAYMRQRDLLLPWRNAVENAALLLEAGGMRRREARARAAERFPDVGLSGYERHRPDQLSGGMRQRVAFLRTMLPGRPLLLLDEPFGALDALTRAEMQAWLAELLAREGRAVLLVTHDVDEAIVLGSRVVVLGGKPARVAHVEEIALPVAGRAGMTTDPRFVAHKAAVLRALGSPGVAR